MKLSTVHSLFPKNTCTGQTVAKVFKWKIASVRDFEDCESHLTHCTISRVYHHKTLFTRRSGDLDLPFIQEFSLLHELSLSFALIIILWMSRVTCLAVVDLIIELLGLLSYCIWQQYFVGIHERKSLPWLFVTPYFLRSSKLPKHASVYRLRVCR